MEVSCGIGSRRVSAVLLLLLLWVRVACQNVKLPQQPPRYDTVNRSRRLMRLVKEPPLLLPHDDDQKSTSLPVVAEATTLPIHVIWYGNFSEAQKRIVVDFFDSFDSSIPDEQRGGTFSRPPSVSSWWKSIAASPSSEPPPRVQLQSQILDTLYSKGRSLSNAHVQELVLQHSLEGFRASPSALYLLLTSDDVAIEGFCASSCASRGHLRFEAADSSHRGLQFAWVGNSATQCAGACAWPFVASDLQAAQADSQVGAVDLEAKRADPQRGAVVPPNEDVGMDGMIINIAATLAGAPSTTPFQHRGDSLDEEIVTPLGRSWREGQTETANVCHGVFGEGAYLGYPGRLWKEKISGSSFNAFGANDRRFLLPVLWDRATQKCKIPS